MKDKFKTFLRLENMLSEFEYDFKEHGFRADKTFDEFLDTTEPGDYISSAFQWNKTSRSEDSYEQAQKFYLDLTTKWFSYMGKTYTKNLKPKTSDRQKIRKYILVYLKAIRKNGKFSGTQLASYCLDKAKCKERHTDTVLRYLRQLAAEGKVRYEVLSKPESKYIKL